MRFPKEAVLFEVTVFNGSPIPVGEIVELTAGFDEDGCFMVQHAFYPSRYPWFNGMGKNEPHEWFFGGDSVKPLTASARAFLDSFDGVE